MIAQRPSRCSIIAHVRPTYIELFDDSLNILQNLQQRIITPANVMLSDTEFLLHEQLDDPRN